MTAGHAPRFLPLREEGYGMRKFWRKFGLLAVAGAVLVCGETSPPAASDADTAQALFGSFSALLRKPVVVRPGTGDQALCAILGWSALAWQFSRDPTVPESVEDLARGGHLLWKLRDLKKLENGALGARLEGQGLAERDAEVDRALKSAGERRYWVAAWTESDGKASAVIVRCAHRPGPGSPVAVSPKVGHRVNRPEMGRGEPSAEVPPEFRLTEEQYRNGQLLLQLVAGIRYYYLQKGAAARTRAELAGVLGEETSAWQNKDLASVFEQFLKDYRIEERKASSLP